jgi:hypothetical protein
MFVSVSVFVLALACLPCLPGCTDQKGEAEIMRLNGVIKLMADEATRVSRALPSEQPAVLAELDAAKKQMVELRDQVAIANRAVASAREATKGEVLPLSAWMKEVDARLGRLDSEVARRSAKGHTHNYRGGEDLLRSTTSPD